MGFAMVEETANLSGKSVCGAHRVLECTQLHLPGNQCQGSTWKGIIHLQEVKELTEYGGGVEQVALFPL